VVALYITRAPTPFVAKVAPPAASDTSASEAQYDPNRPLQGKTPGQPVPQANQPAPPNTAPGQTNGANPPGGMLQEPQIVEVPPASSPAANNGVAVAPQPAQDQAASGTVKKPQQATSAPSSTAAAPASNAADANSGYFLQVGAYKTSADAEQQRARLAFGPPTSVRRRRRYRRDPLYQAVMFRHAPPLNLSVRRESQAP
jgi:cell division protein FtsN